MKPKPKRLGRYTGRAVEVVWLDAHHDSSWERPDDIKAELVEVTSVGLFLKATDDVVVLCMDRSDGLVNAVGMIDRHRVLSVRPLEGS